MIADTVVLAVFTGTGNTLVAAQALADRLGQAGKKVRLIPADRPEALAEAGFSDNASLGIAVPVACFTTYPTVMRFIDALPDGKGRSAFFLASMGGFGGGMQGPIGRVLIRKGYRLVGSRLVRMAANYGDSIPTEDTHERIYAHARSKAEKYADQLLSGQTRWGASRINVIATLFAWMGKRKWLFKLFYRLFPLTVDKAKCTGCKLCVEICPERNNFMQDGKAVIGGNCQSCQRCIGFCPVGAITVAGKKTKTYRAVPLAEFLAFLHSTKPTREQP